jgi:hypothetical protein
VKLLWNSGLIVNAKNHCEELYTFVSNWDTSFKIKFWCDDNEWK